MDSPSRGLQSSETRCISRVRWLGIDIAGGPGSIVSAWVRGNPAQQDSAIVIVFLGGDTGFRYFSGNDDPLFGSDGSDLGTYTWNSVTKQLDFDGDPG